MIRKRMLAAAVLLVASGLVVCCATRGYNRWQFNLMSIEQERKWGAELKSQVDKELASRGMDHQDPEVTSYIDDLGRRLLAYAPEINFEYTFSPVKDPSINAFAIPGGHIYVHTALIAEAGSESELAGVMAHEIGHVVARHGSERFSALLAAVMVGNILVESQEEEMDRVLTELAVQVVTTGSMLAYSRANENEADMIGARIMYKAGYDPQGMVRFFDRLHQERGDISRFEEFLSTHPAPENRKEKVKEYVSGLPPRQDLKEDSPRFHTISSICESIRYPEKRKD